MSASGSARATNAVASASAGPVPRATGSATSALEGMRSRSSAAHASACDAAVTTRTESPMPSTRSTEARSSVAPPAASGSKCFGLASRLSGHSRVPLPPARTRTCRLTMGPPGGA